MLLTIGDEQLTGVEYPAIVQDEEKAIATLGGIENISKAMSVPGARLHLNFRPAMHFSRAANGDATPAQTLVLRVRRLRNRVTGEEKIVVSDAFAVPTVFRFMGMCDYQFDPFRRLPGEHDYEVFYSDIVPQRPSLGVREWLNRHDVPLYLPPAVYSRQDMPSSYDYAPKFKTESRIKEELQADEREQIRVMRKSRKNNAISIYYNQPVPDGPKPGAMDKLHTLELKACYEAMSKLFQERPVWPKSAVAHKLSTYSANSVRFVLPCLAYYCLSGPWARLWIRFGYNPKLDKAAKPFQTVDFRIVPRFTGEELLVPPRRRTQERADPFPRGPTNLRSVQEETPAKEQIDEFSYTFRPDTLPNARQINYMLCDIHEDSVQALLHANDGQEPDVCDPNDGWCIKGYAAKVRDILNHYTDKALGRRRPPYHIHAKRVRSRAPAAAPKDEGEDLEEEEEEEEEEVGIMSEEELVSDALVVASAEIAQTSQSAEPCSSLDTT